MHDAHHFRAGRWLGHDMLCRYGRAVAVLLVFACALAGSLVAKQKTAPAASAAAAPAKVSAKEDARLRSFANEMDELRGFLEIPGLSAAIVEKGEVVWARGYGLAETQRRVLAAPETIYAIDSLTKTMTAVLVMQMAEQGKLSLDDPVSKYRSDADVQPATHIRNYLSHTSEGVPGTRFSYNGARYARLASILEKVSGKSLRDLMVENILDKLHMDASIPGLDAAREEPQRYERLLVPLARPHAPHEEPPVQLVIPPEKLDGAMGVISSVLDMAKYVASLRGEALVSAASKSQMFTPFRSTTGINLPYGLGWFVGEYRGHKLVWHYGQEGGYSSLLMTVPDRDIAFVALSNSSGMSEPFWLVYGDAARSPFVLAFLRTFVDGKKPAGAPPDWKLGDDELLKELARKEHRGFDSADELLDRALALEWKGEHAGGARLFKLALRHYPRLRDSAGAALLSVFARSADATLQKEGEQIGRALLAETPDNPRTLFDLGVLLFKAHRAGEAVPLFKRVVEHPNDTNQAVLAWSAYLLADIIAEDDPAEARACLKKVLETKYEDGSLQDDARKLLEKLSK